MNISIQGAYREVGSREKSSPAMSESLEDRGKNRLCLKARQKARTHT